MQKGQLSGGHFAHYLHRQGSDAVTQQPQRSRQSDSHPVPG
ncbi:hypothetical protein LEMLEM_LOCUS25060, partial [Lemmus lemmus]